MDHLHQILQLTRKLKYADAEGLIMAYLRIFEIRRMSLSAIPSPYEITSLASMVGDATEYQKDA